MEVFAWLRQRAGLLELRCEWLAGAVQVEKEDGLFAAGRQTELI